MKETVTAEQWRLTDRSLKGRTRTATLTLVASPVTALGASSNTSVSVSDVGRADDAGAAPSASDRRGREGVREATAGDGAEGSWRFFFAAAGVRCSDGEKEPCMIIKISYHGLQSG